MAILITIIVLLAVVASCLAAYCGNLVADRNSLQEYIDHLRKESSKPSALPTVWAFTPYDGAMGVSDEKKARKRLCSRLGYLMLRTFPDALTVTTLPDGTKALGAAFQVSPSSAEKAARTMHKEDAR